MRAYPQIGRPWVPLARPLFAVALRCTGEHWTSIDRTSRDWSVEPPPGLLLKRLPSPTGLPGAAIYRKALTPVACPLQAGLNTGHRGNQHMQQGDRAECDDHPTKVRFPHRPQATRALDEARRLAPAGVRKRVFSWLRPFLALPNLRLPGFCFSVGERYIGRILRQTCANIQP